MPDPIAPDAELLIAPGCPHCPAVLNGLADLVKTGRIGELKIINLAVHPAAAAERGARGAPWMRIGPFELVGAHTPDELRTWVDRAGTQAGRQAYLVEQLTAGELDAVIAVCRRDPSMRLPLIELAGDLDTPFAVRVGIGAIFEDLGPDGRLKDLVDVLEKKLTTHTEAQVRADAAHFLGLTGNPASLPTLNRMTQDPDAEVREIAAESVADIESQKI
jgi:hypothetical protein